jgi:5'-deoxynucleotidase YfbR-like HD superfamily hydrolase
MNKAKSVIDYYMLNNRLKNVIRTGWQHWGVNRSRVESVAEHVYGTLSLAIAMYSQYNYDLDFKKVLYILSVHELEEILIGDLTAWEISREEKEKKGHMALKEILKDLINKDEIENLILEFDNKSSKEAIFAYHIDKIECDIQCKIYDEENCVDVYNQIDNPSFSDKRVQELLVSENGSWSKMWIEYDKNKHLDDANFIDLLDYIKDNKISR